MERGLRRPLTGLVAMLAAALLLAAVVADCALLRPDGHSHALPSNEIAIESGSPTEAVADCGPHLEHCVKSALPAAPESAKSQLPTLLVVVLALMAACMSGSDGVRGPPFETSPAVSGRMLLTRLCIARR